MTLERVREVREGAQGQIYWTLTHQDARGNATRTVLGNGMELLRTFNALTGEPENLLDSVGAQVAQNTQLVWDQISRLQERHDLSNSQQERFFYDGRNRLTRIEARQGTGAWSAQQRNILCKSDVPGSTVNCSQASHSNYTYGSDRPHAVTQAGNRTFSYDNNGNVVADFEDGSLDRQFVYTSFDLLRRVSRGSLSNTEIYTHVAIHKLKSIHEATHPARLPEDVAERVREARGQGDPEPTPDEVLDALEREADEEREEE